MCLVWNPRRYPLYGTTDTFHMALSLLRPTHSAFFCHTARNSALTPCAVQEEVVAKLLEGESCAGVFPTGAGKSICYQLPGTLMARQGRGLTLVVSPLIALMKDQVRSLEKRGASPIWVGSTHEYSCIVAGVCPVYRVVALRRQEVPSPCATDGTFPPSDTHRHRRTISFNSGDLKFLSLSCQPLGMASLSSQDGVARCLDLPIPRS